MGLPTKNPAPPMPLAPNPPSARLGALSWLLCLAVLGVYVLVGRFDDWQLGREPRDAYYNQLVQGFAAGHLYLNITPPPALLRLPDPYDPAANLTFRSELHDLSLYRDRLYLYFGATPAVLVFWPYHAMTGTFLAHRDAVILFCAGGFLASVLLLHDIRRRCFASTPFGIVAGAVLALGLAGMPILLGRADVWEVPISCGYFLLMLSVLSLWHALHSPQRAATWIAVGSAAYGLALGARPSLLIGAVILLVPLVCRWTSAGDRAGRRTRLVIATFAPIIVAGIALLVYNALRFQNPLEFGQHYQLAGDTTSKATLFSPRYAWDNLHAYFLRPATWTPWFPFVEQVKTPGTAGHLATDGTFGILINLPITWLSIAAILWATRSRTAPASPSLRAFVLVLVVLAVALAGVLCLFAGACDRYEVEFLPPILLLACIGAFVIDGTLGRWPLAQGTERVAVAGLLVASVAFSMLASHHMSVDSELRAAKTAFDQRRYDEALPHYSAALRLDPRSPLANFGYGLSLAYTGSLHLGTVYLGRAVALDPYRAGYRGSYGEALAQCGHLSDGRRKLEQALQLDPSLGFIHQGLGRILLRQGDVMGAAREFETAAQLQPDLPNLPADREAVLKAHSP